MGATSHDASALQTNVFGAERGVPEAVACVSAQVVAIVDRGPLGAKGERYEPEDNSKDLEAQNSPAIVGLWLAVESNEVVCDDQQCGAGLLLCQRDRSKLYRAYMLTVKRVKPNPV